MIPPFENGNLPIGRHVTDVVEVEQRLVMPFVASITREGIYRGWRERRAQLSQLIDIQMEWIDGSFVTAKRDPRDIDLVTFLNGEDFEDLDADDRDEVMKLVRGPGAKLRYGCDTYFVAIRPHGHPGRQLYERARGQWDDFWSHRRSGHEKGYLDVRGEA